MNIARVLYPVEVLGPGKRVGIWTCGCSHHCEGCSNPALWEPQPKYEITISEFCNAIETLLQGKVVDGFVITGGDPFYQADELAMLLPLLRHDKNPAVGACLESISVLIDGKYIQAQNDGVLLCGSSNQRIIYLDPAVKPKYQEYLDQLGSNKIQNFLSQDGLISVGIHQADFQMKLVKIAREKGVVVDDGK